MYKKMSMSLVFSIVLLTGLASLSSTASFGLTSTKHSVSWEQRYKEFLSALPSEAKKPGWSKPKATQNTTSKTKKKNGKKRKPATNKSSSTLSSRVSKLSIPSAKAKSLKRAIPSSAVRTLRTKVKGTAKLLANRPLTLTRKDQAKSELRKKTKQSQKLKSAKKSPSGRSGKQARLRELMNDPKISSSERGWLKNDARHIKYGSKSGLRVPRNGRNSPGRKSAHKGLELAHPRNAPASGDNSYAGAKLKNYADHIIETKMNRHRY